MEYMKSLITYSFLSLVILFQTGCISFQAINHDYSAVNYADGINAHEAKVIAQHYYLKENPNKDLLLSFPKVENDESSQGLWRVTFFAKSGVFFENGTSGCRVFIDRLKGIVKEGGCWSS
jgi:hypothetical protein